MMRKWLVTVFLAAFALAAQRAGASNDASIGYETIRPSLVKVWTFDPSGRPLESGTGIIVDSNDRQSRVLTASHVVAGAARIRIDISRDVHDIPARVDQTGPRDLTLLTVDRGGLHAARFAPRTHAVVEGNLVAVAGYVKNDELIGVVGQEPRVLFPGTVSSRPDNGLYLELENVHIEEGLSGGAVFDPGTGQIFGIVTSRTSDRRGGFADSGAFVVLPFLEANHVGAAEPPLVAHVAPAPRVMLVAATPPPSPPMTLRPLPMLQLASLPVAIPRPLPAATLQAVIAVSIPSDFTGGVVSWRAGDAAPSRFIYTRAGCRVAVTIDVQNLQFIVANRALVQPHHRGALLAITLSQRAGSNVACDNVPDAEPVDAAYEPIAMSFDGHHVTMRFVYAGDPENGDRFPSDASIDADLGSEAPSATLQFFATAWTGSIQLPLARTPLASVSSNW